MTVSKPQNSVDDPVFTPSNGQDEEIAVHDCRRSYDRSPHQDVVLGFADGPLLDSQDEAVETRPRRRQLRKARSLPDKLPRKRRLAKHRDTSPPIIPTPTSNKAGKQADFALAQISAQFSIHQASAVALIDAWRNSQGLKQTKRQRKSMSRLVENLASSLASLDSAIFRNLEPDYLTLEKYIPTVSAITTPESHIPTTSHTLYDISTEEPALSDDKEYSAVAPELQDYYDAAGTAKIYQERLFNLEVDAEEDVQSVLSHIDFTSARAELTRQVREARLAVAQKYEVCLDLGITVPYPPTQSILPSTTSRDNLAFDTEHFTPPLFPSPSQKPAYVDTWVQDLWQQDYFEAQYAPPYDRDLSRVSIPVERKAPTVMRRKSDPLMYSDQMEASDQQ